MAAFLDVDREREEKKRKEKKRRINPWAFLWNSSGGFNNVLGYWRNALD